MEKGFRPEFTSRRQRERHSTAVHRHEHVGRDAVWLAFIDQVIGMTKTRDKTNAVYCGVLTDHLD